jgi:hypothetical protein
LLESVKKLPLFILWFLRIHKEKADFSEVY